jgi:lycopene cyclase domain-containing protein
MKEYTVLAAVSVLVTIVLDRLLGTRVLGKIAFWIFLSIMTGFTVIVNGYLTWRPVVLYNQQFFLDIRLWTIPVEDFLFGFALITCTIILWEFFKGREDRNGI